MNNSYTMVNPAFESEKRIKATITTVVVLAIIILLAIWYKWQVPSAPQVLLQDGIEVNLGNSETGLGDIQPQLPGEPAPDQQEANIPPPANDAAAEEKNDPETNDNDPEPAPVVKTNPNPTKQNNVTPTKPSPAKPVPNTLPTNPTPPKRDAKALYKGGNGSGGNNANIYNDSRNQGDRPGPGDRGKPNGNPNAGNYEGNGGHGTSGVSISRGLSGRRITGGQSFEDDFNQNAKIAVDITVDASGRVVRASFQPRGSTESNAAMKAIAIRRAQQLKFNAGGEEQSGTVIFNFKLKN
jgi:hypothetical protein